MQWVLNNINIILTCLLVLTEATAAISQLAFPNNQGVHGIIAGMIKVLQALGAKSPDQKS